MGFLSLSIPQAGLFNSTEDPKIASDFSAIQTVVNGGLDATNLSLSAGILNTQLLMPAWSNLTLNTSITTVAGAYVPQARIFGDMIQLCGVMQNTSSEATGYQWATVPGSMFPAQQVQLPLAINTAAGGYFGLMTITSGGVLAVTITSGLSVASNSTVGLDGLWYRKT